MRIGGVSSAIEATGAERVFATHGSVGPLTRYLQEKGLDAQAIATAYGDEDDAPEAGFQPESAP